MTLSKGEFIRLTDGRLDWPLRGRSGRLDKILFALMDGQGAARRDEVLVLVVSLILSSLTFEQLVRLSFDLLANASHCLYLYCTQDIDVLTSNEPKDEESRICELGDLLKTATDAVGGMIARHNGSEPMRRIYRNKVGGARAVVRTMVAWPLYRLEGLLGEGANHCYVWDYCQTINKALDEAAKRTA